MRSYNYSFVLVLCMTMFLFLEGCIYSSITEPNKNIQDYNELFDLELYSDKEVYKTTDNINIWATLKYKGKDNKIEIWHGKPYIVFSISDGKEFNISGMINTILTSTTLEKNRVYTFNYIKSGGYANSDPNAEYWKKFYDEKDLHLPKGEYTVKVNGAFSLYENDKNGKNDKKGLSKELNIFVKE